MTDRENESLAEWLFYARKQRHRRRNPHTTHSNTTNTQEDKK